MSVSSRNCGSIRGLCAFVVCLFLAGEFRNLPVALLAGRKRAPDFHAFPAGCFHPPCARSPVPWPSRGIASAAAPLGCFPIGIPLPSPSSTFLSKYIRQVYTFLFPVAKKSPASRSPGTRHSERGRPACSSAFAPAVEDSDSVGKASACAERALRHHARFVCVMKSLFSSYASIAALTSSQTKRNNYPPASHSLFFRPANPRSSAPRSQSSAGSHARPGCSALPPPVPAPPPAQNR